MDDTVFADYAVSNTNFYAGLKRVVLSPITALSADENLWVYLYVVADVLHFSPTNEKLTRIAKYRYPPSRSRQ